VNLKKTQLESIKKEKYRTYRNCSAGDSNAMILTRFKGCSKYDIYKCLDLFLRYSELENIRGNKPSAADVRRLKLLFFPGPYSRKLGHEISLDSLTKIEEMFQIKICVWVKRNQRDSLRIAWENKTCYYDKQPKSTMNLYSATFDPYVAPDLEKLAVILDLEQFTKNNNYNPTNNTQPWRKMTIFQAVVSELHPTLVGTRFQKKVQDFEKMWGKNEFELSDIKKFYKLYGLGIQFWTRQTVGKTVETKKVFDSYWKKKVILLLEDFDEHQVLFINWTLTYILDISYTNFHGCPNKYCLFGTNNINNLQKHLLSCRSDTLVKYKQIEYSKPNDKLRQQLVDEKILPSLDYHNMNFAVFDVETLMVEPSSWDITGLISIHKLATIAVVTNFGPKREHFMYRRDMGPNGLKLLVEEFVDLLMTLRLEMTQNIPTSIINGLTNFYSIVKTEEFKKLSPIQKADVYGKIRILKDLISLRNYSWNGERKECKKY